MLNPFTRMALGVLTTSMLLLAPACGRLEGDRDVKEQAQRAGEVEKLNQEAQSAAATQARKLAEAGVNNVAPDPNTLQLTDPQKAALEARIKVEKNSSYQALLQEVLDKDKEITGLNLRMAQLRATLPRPELAKADDTHYGMAMDYLRRRGLPEEKARQLVSKVAIMDQLKPGFEVYHFYSHGVYGTWVAQGKADLSPTQFQAQRKAQVEGERDAATQRATQLQASVADLTTQRDQLTTDIAALHTEKTQAIADLKMLKEANEAQLSSLNSVHFKVGSRKELVKEGVIVVPVFARDRAGANWADKVFDQSLDLRAGDSVVLTAAEAGLDKINKVDVVPGSLEKDKHYTLAINEDRTTATIRFLAKDRFRNEKVVFALAD